MKTVLVDIYGADLGTQPVIRGSLKALEQVDDIQLCFIGDEALVMAEAQDMNADTSRISVIHTTDYVSHHESPAVVLRGREQASVALALSALKANPDAIGLISPGNTGALLVGSIFRLGLVGGLKSPALCSVIPSSKDCMMALLDCGANMDCRSDDLVRYGLMGSALIKSLGLSDNPRVALLSVGREDSKGNKLSLEAFAKLSALPINFVGNIEGLDVVSGEVDVLVTDGFAGNILLKTLEAVGKHAIGFVDDALNSCDPSAQNDLKVVKSNLKYCYDFNPRGGATFLGTEKPIIKMHGSAIEATPLACIEQLLTMEKAGYREALIEALNSQTND